MFDVLSEYPSAEWGFIFLRVAIAVVFLYHAYGKIPLWKAKPSEHMTLGMIRLLRLTSIFEGMGGILMLTGFFTEIASFSFMVIMLGALYFKLFKWKAPFSGANGWELDFILLAANIAVFTNGDGMFTLFGY
ncbi:MAG: DoxX family protein [bacterium]|nr:DoxX family protein [bacterium]